MPSRNDTDSTIHDVARRLGISATTVSRAVHNRPRISSRTRRRVLDEVRRCNYRPSLVAQTLSSGKSQTLGVVVPTIASPVFAALVRAVEMVAFERGYNILLCDTDFDLARERHYVELLTRRHAEGVVLVPFTQRSAAEQEHLDELVRQQIPIVAVQQRLVGRAVPQVVPDNVRAAEAAVTHLLNLGHRRIAFAHCGLSPRLIAFHERYRGYISAMRKAGVTIDESLVAKVAAFDPRAPGAATCDADAVEQLVRGAAPTAIFAPTDMLALRLIALLRSLSVRIPEDVAIVGFDDIQMADTATPPLTTVRQPTERIGRRAAEILFDAIGGNPAPPTIERMACELIVRESCGATVPQGAPT